MSRYILIKDLLWESERVINLSDSTFRLYIYILTTPHGNSCGFYKLKPGYVYADLIINEEKYRRCLKEIIDAELIEFDKDSDLILIYNHLKHNKFTNPKHALGGSRQIDRFINYPIFESFLKQLIQYCPKYIKEFTVDIGYLKPLDSLMKGLKYSIYSSDKYKYNDIDSDNDNDNDNDIDYKNMSVEELKAMADGIKEGE